MARPLTRRPRVRSSDIASADSRDPDLTPVVGANLRRLRVQRGLSLERLAKTSQVSRAMISQIELHQSTPTINVVSRIASALGVPFSALVSARGGGGPTVLRAADAKVLSSAGGGFRSRALFPFDGPRRAELYELFLAAGALERAEPHAPGTTENIVVAAGRLEIVVGGDTYSLACGDAVLFEADVPHAYKNSTSGPAVAYLVMTYASEVG